MYNQKKTACAPVHTRTEVKRGNGMIYHLSSSYEPFFLVFPTKRCYDEGEISFLGGIDFKGDGLRSVISALKGKDAIQKALFTSAYNNTIMRLSLFIGKNYKIVQTFLIFFSKRLSKLQKNSHC